MIALCRFSKGKLCPVFLIPSFKLRIPLAFYFMEVFVGGKQVFFQLDHGHGNIGAMVGDPFQVCLQIIKHEALLDGAFPPL